MNIGCSGLAPQMIIMEASLMVEGSGPFTAPVSDSMVFNPENKDEEPNNLVVSPRFEKKSSVT